MTEGIVAPATHRRIIMQFHNRPVRRLTVRIQAPVVVWLLSGLLHWCLVCDLPLRTRLGNLLSTLR